jgi:hypothetical protein
MKKNLGILLCSFLATACSVEKNETVRSFNPESTQTTSNQVITPLYGALDDVEITSCSRLGDLAAMDSTGLKFSYFRKAVEKNQNWIGGIEISESPFTQFILGEKFVNGSSEDFYKKAEAEYLAGRLGEMKWLYVKFMKNIGSLDTVQHSKTNEVLTENFPGIFGEFSDLNKSLFLSLANRALPLDRLPMKEASAVLGSRISLFPGSEWKNLPSEVRLNLGSALKGLKAGAPDKERLCSLVLLHHHFAQLLRLKGHETPEIFAAKRKKDLSRIEELSKKQPEFRTKEISGAFFDLKENRSIVVSNESITGYDPRSKMLGITSLIPNGEVSLQKGNLGDSLSFMEALAYSFEASSPASSLVDENGYLFGDVQAAGSNALLPAEAHSLALGLLSMNFKNLAALHIRKVNAKGLLVQDQSAAAGIVVGREWKQDSSELHLEDVIRLAKVVAYLDVAMNRFRAKEPKDWEQMNPVYNAKTLASLMGPALFTEEELKNILSPAERSTVLKDNLRALKFPLALLLARMGTNPKGCVSVVQWNGVSGEVNPIAPCSREELVELADVFEKLARESQSPLLLKKAEEIRSKL